VKTQDASQHVFYTQVYSSVCPLQQTTCQISDY